MTADPGIADPELIRFRRSPLAHREADLAAFSGAVAMVEYPFLAMVSLRVDPTSEVAARVERSLGIRLPDAGRVESVTLGDAYGIVSGEVRSVLWLGPDEWLVIGPDGDTANLVGLLVEAVADGPGSVVDVSANRDTLVLSGPRARDVLEKGCTLDLHPRAFGPGQCAQTTFAKGQLLIWQTGAEDSVGGPVYRLLFRGSFADYFADWLTDAATEFVP